MTCVDGHFEALMCLGDVGFFLNDPDSMLAYETPTRGAAGVAACVLRPSTTEMLSSTLAYCVQNRLSPVVQSGNTGLVGDATPDAGGQQIVLSLDRMTGTFALNRLNRSLTVSSGMRLSDINRYLSDQALELPIDLSSDPMAGGLVATNAGGARFLRYGGVREQVLGLTVVLADTCGTVLKLGSELRKDNSGPDWKQLFIGSGASMGVISECIFEVSRRPVSRETAFLIPVSETAIDLILLRLEEAFGPQLTAFESMSWNAVRHAVAHVPSLKLPFHLSPAPEQILLVEVSRDWCTAESDMPLTDYLEQALSSLWIGPDPLIQDACLGRSEDMWALRHALSEGLRRAGPVIAFDLSFTRDRVNPFKSDLRAQCAERYPQLELCDFGHVGDGGVHLNFVVREGMKDHPALREELEDWVYDMAIRKYGGSFSAEHGVGRKNQRIYEAYTLPATRRFARNIIKAITPIQLGAFTAG